MSEGSSLVQFAKSLSPRFNFHFSFCSRSKRQRGPHEQQERGEDPRPRHTENGGEGPHPLSPISPLSASSGYSAHSKLSKLESDQIHVANGNLNASAPSTTEWGLSPRDAPSIGSLPLPVGLPLRRTDSSSSTSSASSVLWVPPPWDGYSPSHVAEGAEPLADPARSSPPPAFDTDCECPICLEPISNSDLEPLTGCEHILHAHCLRELLLHAQADCLLPARCPVAGCRAEILEPDLRRALPAAAYSSYRSAEWRHYVDSHPAEFVRCPTANCTFVFSWNEAEYTAAPHSALCPECQHAYCLRCRCNWHPRASCEESGGRAQDWLRTERVLSSLGFRRCRQCRHWVEKSAGCNKITCRCGYRFCHKCGSENARCNCSSIFHVFYPHYMVLSNWK